jgi:hypothetical protein
MTMNLRIRFGCCAAFILATAIPLAAQPSGGPYGPIPHTYTVPDGARTVFYVAPDGIAGSRDNTVSTPVTLEAAIERVQTGDVIVLRGGTYRTGNLVFNQGITIQPYNNEVPILKGSKIAPTWEDLGNGLWTTAWKSLFPSKPDDWWRRKREGKKTPLYRFNNDMVFVDGRFLQAVGWQGEVDSNSYYIDYDAGQVYIGVNPTSRLVEITAFDCGLRRTTGPVHGKESDRKGFALRGVTLTQYAYRAIEIEGKDPEGVSPEVEHGKEVVGTTLEDCTISYCSRVAGYFRGDHFTMRRCRISDTSTEGVYIIGSSDVLLERNVFTRNNIESITGYYPAAVKIFNQCYRVTCRDNLVTDLPQSNGIWYDVGNRDGVFVNNLVEGVGHVDVPMSSRQLWPSDNGFFFEISHGALCAGNVFLNCDHGVMALNSENVTFAQNTFVNSVACIGRNARVAAGDHFGWHPSTGPDVDKREGHVFVNNLLVGEGGYARPLLFVWQPDTMGTRLPGPQLKEIAHNVYVRTAQVPGTPLILWSPASEAKTQAAYESPDELQGISSAFARGSKYFPAYQGPLFTDRAKNAFELQSIFPGAYEGTRLSKRIRDLIGGPSQNGTYVGAYPPGP